MAAHCVPQQMKAAESQFGKYRNPPPHISTSTSLSLKICNQKKVHLQKLANKSTAAKILVWAQPQAAAYDDDGALL